MGFENLTAVEQFGSSAAEKLLDTGLQYYSQKNLNEQAQANTQKNMRLASDLALRNQYQSIVNTPMAMRAAGLNPALMNQGVSTIAGVGSPIAGPSGQMSRASSSTYAENVLAAKQMALLQAQIENIKADTADKRQKVAESESRVPTYGQSVKESEARIPTYAQSIKESGSRIDWNNASIKQLEQSVKNMSYDELLLSTNYRREIDKDSLAGKFVADEFKVRSEHSETQYERDFWNALYEEASDGSFTLGALTALRQWVAYNDEAGAFQNNELARQVQSKVMSLQLDDNDVLYSLAHMSSAAYRQTLASAKDLIESAKFRKVARELQLPSEAAFLEQQKITMKNNDFIGHVNNGEYGLAALTQVPSLAHLAEEAAFLYLLRGRGAGASPSAAPLPYSSMNPKDVQRALELSKNEIKALKQAKKSADNNRRLGELYREEKELIGRLKSFNATDYSR